MSFINIRHTQHSQTKHQRLSVALPDRAVHKAAKALSFSLFMMLKKGHCSRVIRAPPANSRVRYRLSATMHSHRTPANTRNKMD